MSAFTDDLKTMMSDEYTFKKHGFHTTCEATEFRKRYSDTYIAYGRSPFLVEDFKDSSVIGSRWEGTWFPEVVPVDCPELDFIYPETGYFQYQGRAYKLDRRITKQWKHGIYVNNASILDIVMKANVPLNPPMVAAVLSGEYPGAHRLQPGGSVALSRRVAVLRDRDYVLMYKGVVIARSGKVSGPYELPEKFMYLRQELESVVSC